MTSHSRWYQEDLKTKQTLQLFYTALLNYDFDEVDVLLKQLIKENLNKEKMKHCEFLIKCAKLKHSFKI